MTKVSEISEFELIKRLSKVLESGSITNTGVVIRTSIGDDAAVLDIPGGTQIITTDTMVEKVHFLENLSAMEDIGWKLMASNYSDVASMGCVPFSSVVTLGLRPDQSVEGLENLYKGCSKLVEEYGGFIVGGDIVRSDTFFVSATIIGYSNTKNILMRDRANPGDLVGVSGHLGCSAEGLHLLTHALDTSSKSAQHCLARHKTPSPRIKEGQFLLSNGVLAAMDLSDGLVADLGKLCLASNVSAEIYIPSLPVCAYIKKEHADLWKEFALGGGEDYELVFTAPAEIMELVTSNKNYKFTVIGKIIGGDQNITIKDENGNDYVPETKGWDHFNSI